MLSFSSGLEVKKLLVYNEYKSGAYLEPSQTSTMNSFGKDFSRLLGKWLTDNR